MSWQTYVDSNLVGTGAVSRAAIIGLNGVVWAQSQGFDVASDAKAIATAFQDLPGAQSRGVTLVGKKYIVTLADEVDKILVIRGMKGTEGCIIAKTNQAILIGVYQPPLQAQECSKVVQGLAGYLKEHNF